MSDTIKLLLIEGSEEDRELIALEFRLAGYNPIVSFVTDETSLRDALQQDKFDALLCDYELPDINAFSALGAVKALSLDIPFIVVTSSIPEDVAIRAMKMGAHDFVMKDRMAKLVPVVEREMREVVFRREKRTAEEALAENERNLQAIVDNSQSLVLQFDPNHHITMSNKRFEDTYGREDYEQGNRADLLELKNYIQVAHHQVIEKWGPVYGQFYSNFSDRTYHVNSFPIFTADNEIESICTILTDISESQRQERQMLHLQKMEALGQLTSGVAHDFNNLLTIIQGSAEILEEAIDDEMLTRFVKSLLRATQSGAKLTKQLLAFSRTEERVNERVDLSALIADIRSMIESTVGVDVELSITAQANIWPIRSNANKLQNAILNLALNAKDALDGPGKISIEIGNVVIEDSVPNALMPTIPGDYAFISVGDTGQGIDDAIRLKIFEPFFTTKDKGKGTGLGLATLYAFVSQDKGFITLDTTVGEGTVFTLYFPRDKEELKEASSQPFGTQLNYDKNARILVVEDQEDVRSILKAVLEREGFIVETAENAAEGLEKAKSGHPDLVISDIMMPGPEKGNDLVRHIVKEMPEIKTLFISGFTRGYDLSPKVIGRSVKLLRKPFKNEELLRAVRLELSVGQ